MLHRLLICLLAAALLLSGGCASQNSEVEPGPRSPTPHRGTTANPLDLPTP
jgi:hypothetical protein